MVSINMPMPACCNECRMYWHDNYTICCVSGSDICKMVGDPSIRPDWCPLIETPEMLQCDSYIGKHEKINVLAIPNAVKGRLFNGEVWVQCPHCRANHQLIGKAPFEIYHGFKIYKCSCGRFFKDK